ncbi:trypsin-like peptidase domain-containing protein [Nocardia abscessus]|uniref:nSTAND1 domain-containing NTPase n=1 Tax=Nocardia abscessus TaxID=120957 RepID=UPI0018935319|nr:trypsin-like peptidase domain-containing protein [Nocardia abscessus]MBF6221745.1 trypsin-like peptidase domain-containing protein [Nocardia abscessus]
MAPPAEPADSVVRILGATGTVGTGFVVSVPGRLVATCAHVVDFAGGGPDREIEVIFHATGARAVGYVEPNYWRAATFEDVAMIRLRTPVPPEVPGVRLGGSTGSSAHPFRTFGFPRVKSSVGLAATGTITNRNAAGQAELQLSNASEIVVGFSGAPLLDTASRRVVGMVVEILAPYQGRFFQTAFGVPSETLVGICPELEVSELCPYRDLRAFDEEDAEFFFGRSDAVDRLLSVLRRNPRFLAVLGPSGSGKSSLVRAGLSPRLRESGVPGSDRWELVVIRPADLPALDARISGAVADLAMAARVWLAACPDHDRLALVVDQFEEIFVVLDDQTRAEFLLSLGAAVHSTAPVTVILTMRDEFYSRFVREAPALGRALEDGLRNVPPELTRTELTAIIEEPAARIGLRFDADLVTRIVNDAIEQYPGGNLDTAANTVLPLLELTLTQLWRGASDGVMSHATYEQYRGLSGGIGRWADEALDRLGPAVESTVRHILTGLVHLGDESLGTPDSRQRRTVTSLCRNDSELSAITATVGLLADHRLVITTEDTVELIHDALLRDWGLLHEWLMADRRFLSWRQDMERQRDKWERSGPPGGRDEGLLLHGHDLQVARDFRGSHARLIGERQAEYIAESLTVWEREQRRLRHALSEAERQREMAESRLAAAILREQAARAQTLLPLEPVAGLALAADAMIKNVADLPGNLIGAVAVSLHLAVRQARELHILTGHTAPVTGVAIGSHGRYVLSASADRTIRRWTPDGQPIGVPWTGHGDAVTAIAIAPDGQYMLSASADRTIRKWTPDGQPIGVPWTGHGDAVTAIAIAPDGQYMLSASVDRTIRKWTPDGQPIGVPWTGHGDAVTAIAIDPARRYVISAGADRTVRRWAPDGSLVATPWTGHNDAVTAIAIDPSGQFVASVSADSTLRLWDRRGRPMAPPMVGHREAVGAIVFAPDGRTLASGGTDRTVRIWDRDGDAATRVLRGHTSDVNGVVLLDGESRIISASADGTLREWNQAGEPIGLPWPAHDSFVYDLAADPAGQRLASASADGTVRVWDAVAAVPLGTPARGHQGPVRTVRFHPSGRLVASGGADATVRLFELDGTPVGDPFRGHRDEVWALAFSPDSRLLASGGADTTVRLWPLDGNPPGEPFTAHQDTVWDLAFAPHGGWFVTASADRTLRRWAMDGTPLGEPLLGHQDEVCAVAVSADGRFILSGSADATLRLWDHHGNPVSGPMTGHDGPVWAVAFGSDGRLLVSGGADGTVRTWDGGWRAWLERACRRLSRHPAPTGEYAAVTRAVREASATAPWLTEIPPPTEMEMT